MQEIGTRVGAMYTVVCVLITDRMDTALRDDRGEIGSWMILAAGLAAAAVAALALLTPWFGEKATDITGN